MFSWIKSKLKVKPPPLATNPELHGVAIVTSYIYLQLHFKIQTNLLYWVFWIYFTATDVGV